MGEIITGNVHGCINTIDWANSKIHDIFYHRKTAIEAEYIRGLHQAIRENQLSVAWHQRISQVPWPTSPGRSLNLWAVHQKCNINGCVEYIK